MKGFEAYAILDPVTFNFEKAPDYWWTINPPTGGDELAMARFFATKRTRILQDGMVEESYTTGTEVMHREIALTFGGTNIPLDPEKPVEKGGAPLIDPTLSKIDIEEKLKDLPGMMLKEIWGHVGEAVPNWGPEDPKGRPRNG